jgi:hypothetical protein
MHKILLAVAGAALSAASVAFPVYANTPTAQTTTTFTLTSGALTISAPTSANLGSHTVSGTFSGQLGNVAVTDNRGLNPAGWTANVSSSDFTDGTDTIHPGSLMYNAGGVVSSSGTGGTIAASPAFALSSSNQAAYTASTFNGDNSLTWNPLITVNASGTVAGSYTGTITHSVA